jgi:uncharacterized protein YggT (Ycf19 family)
MPRPRALPPTGGLDTTPVMAVLLVLVALGAALFRLGSRR